MKRRFLTEKNDCGLLDTGARGYYNVGLTICFSIFRHLKLIELNTLIINFKNYLRNILIIFGLFNLIAVIPMLINVYSEIKSRIKLSR